MYKFFRDLDRRWVFLLMFLAVGIPILAGLRFQQDATPMVENVFETIEHLPDGSRVLLSLDYDPSTQGELQPMAMAFARHCALKRHKMYFMTLWPTGMPMIQRCIAMLNEEFPELVYGRDYVNLGYQPGQFGVIKSITNNLHRTFTADASGTSLSNIPMTSQIRNIQSMNLLVNVCAGAPGTKEWIQYAATPNNIRIVAGVTGVQTPSFLPYVPDQLIGLLGAIKGAAEYEQTLIKAYPQLADIPAASSGLDRMGPQEVAHMLMIVLIVIGNVVYAIGRSRGEFR